MKALSIKQPWAWAIFQAGKNVENRNWKTDFRGTIAVHASKKTTKAEYEDAVFYMNSLFQAETQPPYPAIPELSELDFGVIVGTVEIVDCTFNPNVSPWFCGAYGFVLENPRPLIEPIPWNGQLGFWTLPDHVELRLRGQLK